MLLLQSYREKLFFSDRRREIIFYSRQILNGIALFQVAFSVYHRKQRKEKLKKILIVKGCEDLM